MAKTRAKQKEEDKKAQAPARPDAEPSTKPPLRTGKRAYRDEENENAPNAPSDQRPKKKGIVSEGPTHPDQQQSQSSTESDTYGLPAREVLSEVEMREKIRANWTILSIDDAIPERMRRKDFAFKATRAEIEALYDLSEITKGQVAEVRNQLGSIHDRNGRKRKLQQQDILQARNFFSKQDQKDSQDQGEANNDAHATVGTLQADRARETRNQRQNSPAKSLSLEVEVPTEYLGVGTTAAQPTSFVIGGEDTGESVDKAGEHESAGDMFGNVQQTPYESESILPIHEEVIRANEVMRPNAHSNAGNVSSRTPPFPPSSPPMRPLEPHISVPSGLHQLDYQRLRKQSEVKSAWSAMLRAEARERRASTDPSNATFADAKVSRNQAREAFEQRRQSLIDIEVKIAEMEKKDQGSE